MFCNQCGQQIPEESSFCIHCGAALSASIYVPVPKKKHPVGIVALLVAIAACIILTSVFIAVGGSEKKLQKQLDLGAKYLDEMDYESALVAFNEALEIEPMSVEAYLGIVEVYIRTNEFETALEYARKGYDLTGDERLKEKIDMIESGNIFASNGWTMKESGYDGDGRLLYWHEFAYNLDGKQASVTLYDAQGNEKQYLELEYDDEGRCLVSYYTMRDSGEIRKCEREYGKNSYCETKYEGTSDVVLSYLEVDTDADGRDLREECYDLDGRLIYTCEYEYDSDGRLIKRTYYDANNELRDYVIHTYNDDGKSLQQQFYDAEGNLEEYTEDVYDDEGELIKSRRYDANGNLEYETIYE